MQGRGVRTLIDGLQATGSYTVRWDGRNKAGAEVASGTYYYQLTVNGEAQSKKMVVLK